MGAWGLGLFQSDHDYECIEKFNKRAGLAKLEKAIMGPNYIAPPPERKGDTIWLAQVGRVRYVGRDPSAGAMNAGRILDQNYSMYADFCSDIATVRKHLDSGVLTEMLVEKEYKMLSATTESEAMSFEAGPGYEFILLGACAMSLGCAIPEHFKTAMRKVFMCVGLMDDAVEQMNDAPNGASPYVNGDPWDFGSLDLNDTLQRANIIGKANETGFVPGNTPGPGTMFYNPPKGSIEGFKELKTRFTEARYGTEACAACGAKEGKEGTALLDCSGCHVRKYCSKECQKAHWKASHKKLCREASKTKKEYVESDTGVTQSTLEDAVIQDLMEATIDDLD